MILRMTDGVGAVPLTIEVGTAGVDVNSSPRSLPSSVKLKVENLKKAFQQLKLALVHFSGPWENILVLWQYLTSIASDYK
jgi:hypothetical protein